ncbi:hypothetical protein NDU88_006778 [Pleurodeles waltl]|uniref:Uncharacterized protein n=1 Tax=Pleurodeles waltl TaxID=8319 RepID=A0AAV7QM59_PLEWA|nr:hypothetical protein NDU88_006778 [Pleurodeles waltl]
MCSDPRVPRAGLIGRINMLWRTLAGFGLGLVICSQAGRSGGQLPLGAVGQWQPPYAVTLLQAAGRCSGWAGMEDGTEDDPLSHLVPSGTVRC